MLPNQAKEIHSKNEEALIDNIPDEEVEKDFEEALINSIPDKEVEGEFNKIVAKMDEENEAVEEVEDEFNKLVAEMDEEKSKKVETPQSHIEHKQPIVSDVEGGNSLFLNELLKNGLI